MPAVRSRMFESVSETGRLPRQAIADRTDRDPESLDVRVAAMALVDGLMEVSLYWAESGFAGDLGDLVQRALDVMEHGLPRENR